MNIFYLSDNPESAARQHCDKHIVKMVIEYAQLLSTAHRLLDGKEYIDVTANNRKIKRWRMEDDREAILYKASHINHPSAVWVRQSVWNYRWLHDLLTCCLDEYTFRYEKNHVIRRSGLEEVLYFNPMNIPRNIKFSEPPLAMPDEYKIEKNSIQSYRNYYIDSKSRFAKWTKRPAPQWYTEEIYLRINNANIHISAQNNGENHRMCDENLRTKELA